MSSAFKNFFITFGVCLIVFGLIGWQVIYPAIISSAEEDNSDTEISGDISEEDTSDESPDDKEKKEGDTFTAVIIGKANDGFVSSIAYFRADEAAKTFSYCFIPTNVELANNIGKNTPAKYLIPQIDGISAMEKISALIGVNIDYYAVMGMDELIAVVEKMNKAYIDISQRIEYPNPEYSVQIDELPDGEEVPDEYKIIIPPGRNILDDEVVKNIMDYNPTDGGEYHVLAKQLYEVVFKQFFTNNGTKKNEPVLASLLNVIKETNITPDVIDSNMDLIFSYDSYTQKEIKISSSNTDWRKIAPLFRDNQ